jgi:hypothetical protein
MNTKKDFIMKKYKLKDFRIEQTTYRTQLYVVLKETYNGYVGLRGYGYNCDYLTVDGKLSNTSTNGWFDNVEQIQHAIKLLNRDILPEISIDEAFVILKKHYNEPAIDIDLRDIKYLNMTLAEILRSV